MIDRGYLSASGELNPQQQQDAMVAAIQSLTMLRALDVQDELSDLRDNDPDPRVRATARAALVSIYKPALP